MASGNRASMREGPLRQLFRKTEEGPAGRGGSRAAARGTRPRARAAHADAAGAPPPRVLERPARQHDARPARPASAAEYEWTSSSPDITRQPELRVVGIGGGGVNAVNRMIEAEVTGVEFVALNTDAQSLNSSAAHVTHQIGADITRGLGSGSNPELGHQAAMEDYDRVKALLKGSDMVFITAGEGGGTGTGAAPVVARIARELGALTVGIVTKPFGFEGSRRMQAAEKGIESLSGEVDTLIVVPNNRLLSVLDKQTSMVDGVPRGRRRAAPGRPGHLRPDHAARPDQPRLRGRADDHVRRRQRPARHRHGPWRQARHRSRPRRRLVAAAGDHARGRALDPARSPAARTCRCGRSTRPPTRSRRPRTRTRTSSSARCSTRSSRTRSGSRSSPRATASGARRARSSRPSASRSASRASGA